jgi:hypothetical protein
MIPTQFAKTLEALEVAEKEMRELWDTLESLETVSRATYTEVDTAHRFWRELRGMMSTVTAMLEKRERAMLYAVRLTHAVDSKAAAQVVADAAKAYLAAETKKGI